MSTAKTKKQVAKDVWAFARFGVHAQLICLSSYGAHAILVVAVRLKTMSSWKHFVCACAPHKVKHFFGTKTKAPKATQSAFGN